MPVGSKLIALLSTSFPLRPSFVFRLARYSRPTFDNPTFAAFSYASVFHGRIHSVFNRPKLGFWSGAINQFHSEAVINEGCGEAATLFSDSKNSHPWPEWSKLADLLVEKGYSDRCMASGDDDDSFSVEENLPEKFLKAAEACLGFARDRPDILRLLAKKNMETIVLNGSPFLFKNGENSARRMKFFLSGEGSNELELERAQTIDIMRYLLSYVYGPLSSSHDNNLKSDEHVQQSVRKLLCELFNLSGTVWKPKSVDATLTELPLSNDKLSGHPGQYIETKTADLINPKIPGRSSAASESQLNASCNFTDKEYGNSIFNQKQGPEVTRSSQTSRISTPNDPFIKNPAQPSTSVLDKNVESWNRIQTSSISNAQIPNESNAVYGSINSSEPTSPLGNNFTNYYGGYTGKPTQPSGNLWTKSGASYGGSTAKSSPPPGNSWNNYNTSFAGYNGNSAQQSSTVSSNNSTPYGGSIVNPSQPPPRDLWSNYNTVNSTQPSSNSWSNNNISSTESTPNSSQPPSGYRGNYSARYDGYSNASQTAFTSNSSQPPSNSWNNHNTSPGGFNEALKQPSTNSYGASTAYSPQAPNNSWNNYNTPYGENFMKSTQPSSNSWNTSNTSFGWPNTNSSTEPSTSSMTSNNSHVGYSADSYHRYPANSNQASSLGWNNSSTSFPGASANPHPVSSSTWNNSREGFSSGFPQANNGLPAQDQSLNGNYGYSGKSLEGSCVKEPDPLDMSEEAKAERWFRRAAQIKDISELSQIPDEDFPQIMPMRKGVNRFVVSKRKTPLERRLASQQYKRSLPVVSSEPEKDPTAGEKED
ncbi:zinc finger protein VAR3, chloroplastic [Dendrobium catenatum]|uniref:Zinc finger protein VAR3, chloroplastic n=1 Tax=Dendrobium catenatum TaxID=906689 RepID=A0A2I0WVV5_9ASPA|nr:zinc finger protein VAR3, chloroplastic [Dendrobium catenatum]PKU79795.1 Zinc finger protein VAR3, chloroplastic [Dendrobium catenatum]